MSQNGPYSGPPWSSSGKGSDEPYGEPSDPWGDHPGAQTSGPPWDDHPGAQSSGPPWEASIPQQPSAYPPGPSWSPAPPPPPKRNSSMMALVVTLGVLIVVGLGATLWMLKQRSDGNKPDAAAPSAAAATQPAPVPAGTEDARYNVKKGECVLNGGTDEKPEMRTAACVSGTYDVLERIEGKTTGEADAERKCGKVEGYTKWYFYDSALDDLDFVLCLKER